jgi:PAS domain S-box-containing protein
MAAMSRDGDPTTPCILTQETILTPAELLETVVETGFSGVAVIEPSTGIFLYVNERACELLGRERGEILATTWQQVTDIGELEMSLQRSERLLTGDLVRVSFRKRIRRPDESWVNLALVLSRAEVKGKVLFVVLIDDLTRDGSVSALIRLVASQPDGDTLARAVVLGVLDSFQVIGASLYRVDLARRSFVLVGNYGVGTGTMSGLDELPLDVPLPISEVYRTASEYRATFSDLARDYPLAAGWVLLYDEHPILEVTLQPVFARGLVVAVILIVTRGSLGRQWQVRNLLDTTCAAVSCWTELASLRTSGVSARFSENLQVTDRQLRVLQLVAEGKTNKLIAVQLGFAEGTVRSDLLRLSRMLKVSGRHNLVEMAKHSGLLQA